MDLHKVLIFLFFMVASVLLESILCLVYSILFETKYKKYRFSFAKYSFLLSAPILITIIFAGIYDWSILAIFFTFIFIGPLFEMAVGYSYDILVGQKLWTYHRYSLYGYSSLLTIPLWGLAGVLLWLIGEGVKRLF